MASICCKCTQNVNTKSPGIQCSFCTKFYHAKCISLSKEQLTAYSDIPGTMYKCEACRAKVNNGCDNCTAMVKAIENMQEMMAKLHAEIQELKDQKKESVDMETIINEVSERQRREKNIIIYNIPENLVGSEANKHASDLQSVVDILKNIAPTVDTQSIKVFRLGKLQDNKPSPIKVELSSRDTVFAVLKNKHKLKNQNMNFQITTDKTYLQRQHLKKVIAELKERTENGEENLFIKYKNGIPTISKSKK